MAYILGYKILKSFKSSQWIWCTLTLKALPSLSHIFLPWHVYFPGASYADLDTSGTIWFWCILSSILPKANDLQLGMKIKFDSAWNMALRKGSTELCTCLYKKDKKNYFDLTECRRLIPVCSSKNALPESTLKSEFQWFKYEQQQNVLLFSLALILLRPPVRNHKTLHKYHPELSPTWKKLRRVLCMLSYKLNAG